MGCIMVNSSTIKVLKYLYDNDYKGRNTVWGLMLTKLIFSPETIKKWSHARRHKLIIETMTYSFLGKLRRKDLIEQAYEIHGGKAHCMGYYIRPDGIELLKNKGII